MFDKPWTCDVCGKVLIDHYPAMEVACAVSLVRRLERAESRAANLDQKLANLSTLQRCVECGSGADAAPRADGFWYCLDAEACRNRRVARKRDASDVSADRVDAAA